MFINFGFEDYIDTYTIEIKTGNQIQKQMIQGAPEMIQLQFMQLLEQVGHSQQPIRLSIIKPEEIWCQYQQKVKTLNNEIRFLNKTYMNAYPEECKEE